MAKQTKQEVKDLNEMPEVRQSKADEMFRLVKDKEGVKITIGNYVISKKVFKTWQQAEDYLNTKPYEIILNAACLFAENFVKTYEKK